MRNLIFKIYALTRLTILKALLLVTLFTVAAFAQGTGDSVVIINTTAAEGPAREVAHWVESKINAGLLNQFPCVDFASTEDIATILGHERMKELLGGEETSEEQWKNLAGAMGARYMVVVSVTILPNGQTIVSVKLLDTKTATTIADEMETGADAESALQNAESVAGKLMQTFGNIFKNKCETHWTGTINYTHLIQTSKTENHQTSSETTSKNLSATANIVLQPMTLGFSSKYSTQARVTQNYDYLDEYSWKQTTEIPCREPGRNTYYKKVSGDYKNTRTEKGTSTQIVSVFITIFEDGRYVISIGKLKPLITKVRLEKSGTPPACRPAPISTINENEGLKEFVYIDIKGQVDPKNPNFLTGTKIVGDLEGGQSTWTWNLRLVNPPKKKGALLRN